MANPLFKDLLSELNQCRSNPRKYSTKLSKTLSFYKGKFLERPDKPPMETREGLENVESCIKYLKTIRPSPVLRWSSSLSQAAQSHVDDIGPLGLSTHTSSDGSDISARVCKFCVCTGSVGENISYGDTTAEDIVVGLLIDDGMLARGQRLNIMKKTHKFVGAGVGSHSVLQCMCVMVFAEDVQDEEEEGGGEGEEEEVKGSTDFTMELEYSKEVYNEASALKGGEKHRGLDGSGAVLKTREDNSLDFSKDRSIGTIDNVDFKSILENTELEISSLSAFQRNNEVSVGNTEETEMFALSDTENEVSLSVSAARSEMPSNINVSVKPLIKSKPATKPPIDPKTIKKKEEFVVSNFERSELSKDAIFEIKELFDIYDTSGSGFLDSVAIKSMKENQNSETINSEIIQVLEDVSPEQIGVLNFENFVELVAEKLGQSRSHKLGSISLTKDDFLAKNDSVLRIPRKAFDPTLYLRPELRIDDIREIKKAFDMFDVDNTGTINPIELKNALRSQGSEIVNSTVFRMVNNLELDGTEKVNFGEFLDMLASEGFDNTSVDEIKKLFSIFDIEKTGYIDLKNLKRIARELGEALDEDEIVDIITKSDLDGDGRVSFEDFYNIMKMQLY